MSVRFSYVEEYAGLKPLTQSLRVWRGSLFDNSGKEVEDSEIVLSYEAGDCFVRIFVSCK